MAILNSHDSTVCGCVGERNLARLLGELDCAIKVNNHTEFDALTPPSDTNPSNMIGSQQMTSERTISDIRRAMAVSPDVSILRTVLCVHM